MEYELDSKWMVSAAPASHTRHDGAPLRWSSGQRRRLAAGFAAMVPPGGRVLQIGGALGDILPALAPSRGVCIDWDHELIRAAPAGDGPIQFQSGDGGPLRSGPVFDYIVLADPLEKLQELRQVLGGLHRFAHARTRLVFHFPGWIPRWASWFLRAPGPCGVKPPAASLSAWALARSLHSAGWTVVRAESKTLRPNGPGWMTRMMSRWAASRPCVRSPGWTVFHLARPSQRPEVSREYSCSVIIPARNEAGSIEELIRRVPEMGTETEIIVVEGHSQDSTWAVLQEAARRLPGRHFQLLKQPGRGKADAVHAGLALATGDILFILDADLTVQPEELVKCYQAIREGAGDFMNGSRLSLGMEDGAMPLLNRVANRVFAAAWSWLLGQKVGDALCGTKVFFRSDYTAMMRKGAGIVALDPFGDFTLLYGARVLNLCVVDVPVRYQARRYGRTNIRRWRDGWRLAKILYAIASRGRFG